MTKDRAQRLKGMFMETEGNLTSLKGLLRPFSPDNLAEMRCLVGHWQISARKVLEILDKEEEGHQQHLFPDDHSLTLDLDTPVTVNGTAGT